MCNQKCKISSYKFSGITSRTYIQNRLFATYIGESTYGATTGNVPWALPFNSTMALTNSYDSDRNGNYYEQIIPDIPISKGDNFDNLLLDKNIQEAIKFISKKG